MEWILYIICGYLLGDLFSGIFHWWEDRYGNPRWPFLGKYVIEPNIEHHKHPSKLAEGSYWENSGYSIIGLTPVIILCFCFQLYVLGFGFIFATQGNQIHSWAHKKAHPFIRFFQRIGIFQSPKNHAIHHKQPYNKNYCVMSDLLNPILTRIYFWQTLEWIILQAGIPLNPERELY